LVEAEDEHNVLAVLNEAGIKMTAEWECECENDDGGDTRAEEDEHACKCGCRLKGKDDDDGWESTTGDNGEDISCHLGSRVRSSSGRVKKVEMNGVVARRKRTVRAISSL